MSPVQDPFPPQDHCTNNPLTDVLVDVGEAVIDMVFEYLEQERLHVIPVVIFDAKVLRYLKLGFSAGSADCVGNLVQTTDLTADVCVRLSQL